MREKFTKGRFLLPLLMVGVATSTAVAVTPPQKVAEVRLPASYASFFPTMSADKVTARTEKPMYRNPAMKLTESSNIYGSLYYFQGTALQQGFYRINSTPAPTFMWADSYTSEWSMPMTGGWLRDGKLCGVNAMNFMGGLLAYGQVVIDFNTGKVESFTPLTVSAESVDNVYITTAYRDLDDGVYGYGHINDGNAYGFKRADADNIDTSAPVCEVEFSQMCTALCYNVQDDLFYGVTTAGQFVSVNAKGEQTSLFALNIPDLSSTVSGLVYSPKDEAYIFNAYLKDRSSAMYSIDANAKTCTKLYDCTSGEEYMFMVCTADNVDSDAPAKAIFAGSDFEGSSLTGSISYTVAGKTFAGNPLSGSLDWKLYDNGVAVKSGTTTPGSSLSIDLSDLTNGKHTFALTLGKDGKWSLPEIKSLWIGADIPNAPTNVKLTETSVTWDASTGSVHDGYVNPAAITYTVTLNGEKVAETSELSCTITLPQGMPYKSYTAKVTAKAEGKTSEPAESNYINYGDPLTVPAEGSLHFRPEEYEFTMFQAIDIDGKTDSEGNTRNWHFSETMGFPSFASGADGDDMLIFPPINFDNTTKAYSFQMEAGLISDVDDTGTIEVLIGKEPTVEAMTRTVIKPTQLHYMRGIIMTEFFSVPEAGTYYLAVRTKTNDVAFHISDMDIALTSRDADVPQTVSDLVATADPKGALNATVTFTMPSLTVNGKAIDANTELKAKVVSREFVIDKPFDGEVYYTKTVTGKPGEVINTVIETKQNYNTIGVSCSLDNRAGVEATTNLFTGVVKPYTVQNLKAEVSEDNMSAHLTWTPPVEGGEPGPIGDSFFYGVWYYADGWQFLDGVGYDVCEATVPVEPGAPQNSYILGVMAMNDAGQSDYIAQTGVVIGTPYELPMVETMETGEEEYWPVVIQRPAADYEGTYWMVDDPVTVSPLFANNTGIAYIGYIGQEGVKSAKSRLSLPKFSTDGVKDVKVSLTYWGGNYGAQFSLLSNVYGATAPTAIGSFPMGAKGWVTNSLDLPADVNGLKWVELLLDTTFPNDNTFGLFSGYSITGVSGIEGVDADGEGRIFTTNGMLNILGMAGEQLTVTDLQGRVIINEPSLGDINGYVLVPGTYIVKAGAKTVKVII